MKWQLGDKLLNKKKKEILYKVIGVSETSYLLLCKPMSVRVILDHTTVESPEWNKYEGVQSVQINKDVPQKRKTKTDRIIRKKNNVPRNRSKKGRPPEVDGGCPSVHRKPSTRCWWKRKKKTPCNSPVNNTDKGV